MQSIFYASKGSINYPSIPQIYSKIPKLFDKNFSFYFMQQAGQEKFSLWLHTKFNELFDIAKNVIMHK